MSGVTTVGVDLGDADMRVHWGLREGGSLSFAPASAYELPYGDDAFDCVYALEVLEHLERPHDALAEMARVAGRALVLSVPREPIWRVAHLAAGRDVRALGNTPGHINHWSSATFQSLVSHYGTLRRVRKPFPWTLVVVDV